MLGGVSMAEERQIFRTRKHFSRNVFLLHGTFIYFDFIVYFHENRFLLHLTQLISFRFTLVFKAPRWIGEVI